MKYQLNQSLAMSTGEKLGTIIAGLIPVAIGMVLGFILGAYAIVAQINAQVDGQMMKASHTAVILGPVKLGQAVPSTRVQPDAVTTSAYVQPATPDSIQ